MRWPAAKGALGKKVVIGRATFVPAKCQLDVRTRLDQWRKCRVGEGYFSA